MFIEMEFEWTIVVQPHDMKSTAHIQRALIQKLLKDFNEIKCTEEHGYYVTPTTIEEIGEGRLWERRACAAYPVRFRCMVCKLCKGEQIFVVVTKIIATGFMCEYGALEEVFVSDKYALQYEFDSTDNCYRIKAGKGKGRAEGSSTSSIIKAGSVVAVSIIGVKWDNSKRAFSAVASLRQRIDDDRWPKPAPMVRPGGSTEGGLTDGGNDAMQAQGGWGEPAESAWGSAAPAEKDDGQAAAAGWGQAEEEDTAAGWG